MSKRISNKRGRQRVTPARSTVKYGYWKTLAMQRAAMKKTGEDE